MGLKPETAASVGIIQMAAVATTSAIGSTGRRPGHAKSRTTTSVARMTIGKIKNNESLERAICTIAYDAEGGGPQKT